MEGAVDMFFHTAYFTGPDWKRPLLSSIFRKPTVSNAENPQV